MDNLAPFSRNAYKNSWLPQEAELLLHAVNNKHFLRVYLPNTPEAYHSALIGFDLTHSEFLLDAFQGYSWYDVHVLMEEQRPLCFSVNIENGIYLLRGLIHQLERTQNGYLVSIKVTQAKPTANKRIAPRVSFSEGIRPKAFIYPAKSPRVKAEISDLSPYGCRLKIYGENMRSHFSSNNTRLNLEFNDEFQLESDCSIKQCVFRRQPCCHNVVRAVFNRLTATQYEQLCTFVDTLQRNTQGEFAA